MYVYAEQFGTVGKKAETSQALHNFLDEGRSLEMELVAQFEDENPWWQLDEEEENARM